MFHSRIASDLGIFVEIQNENGPSIWILST